MKYPYKFNFLQLRRWKLQLKFVVCMIKYKIKRKNKNTGGHSAKNRRNFPSHKHDKCKNGENIVLWLGKTPGFWNCDPPYVLWKNGKCDVTWSLPPPPVKNCHTFSDPLPPLERDILYGRPLSSKHEHIKSSPLYPDARCSFHVNCWIPETICRKEKKMQSYLNLLYVRVCSQWRDWIRVVDVFMPAAVVGSTRTRGMGTQIIIAWIDI